MNKDAVSEPVIASVGASAPWSEERIVCLQLRLFLHLTSKELNCTLNLGSFSSVLVAECYPDLAGSS